MAILVADLQDIGVSARFDRGQRADVMAKGVANLGDLKVTSGGGKISSVATGVAYIPGTLNADQGMYRLWSTAVGNLTHDAAVTNPRLDQIIAYVEDANELGSGALDDGVIAIAKGTEASGTQISDPTAGSYRAGAVLEANLPKNWIRLADVLVPVGAGAIPGGNFVDRRSWANGLTVNLAATAPDNKSGGTQVSPGQAMASMSGLFEFSGLPVEINWHAQMQQGNSSGNFQVFATPGYDGTTAFPGYSADDLVDFQPAIASSGTRGSPNIDADFKMSGTFMFTPPAGRHKIDLRAWSPTGINWWAYARQLTIRERRAVLLTAGQ